MPNNGTPRYSALERAQLKVLGKAVSLVMAPTPAREYYDQFVLTVCAVADLHPNLRRITFRADELGGYRPSGVDECFALLMPPPPPLRGAGTLRRLRSTGALHGLGRVLGVDDSLRSRPAPGRPLAMPSADRLNVRQAIRRLPADRQPDLRWYTIRAHRPAAGEIDVDFVLHGDAGPGSRWAAAATPGEQVGFRAGTASYRPPAGSGHHLLAADETALPALSAILEAHGAGPARLEVYVEVPDASYELPVAAAVTWLHRGADEPGSHVLRAVQAADLSTLDYAWLCGESALATGLRRHLVRERDVDRRRVLFSGYWKRGQARF